MLHRRSDVLRGDIAAHFPPTILPWPSSWWALFVVGAGAVSAADAAILAGAVSIAAFILYIKKSVLAVHSWNYYYSFNSSCIAYKMESESTNARLHW